MSFNIQAVEKAIGITGFKSTHLLERALSGPTYINQLSDPQREQWLQEHKRLALLGDSIYNTAVIEYLYFCLPEALLHEGELRRGEKW